MEEGNVMYCTAQILQLAPDCHKLPSEFADSCKVPS